MTSYGRAISLLRQAEVILVEQVSVDLRVLRSDTAATGGGSATDCCGLSVPVQARWRDVLVAVSPTLVLYGRELDRVDDYTRKQLRSLQFMAGMVCFIEYVVLFLAFIVFCNNFSGNRGDVFRVSVTAGIVIVVALVLTLIFATWACGLNESHRKLRFLQDLPVKHELDRFRSRLSRTFIVKLVASVLSGHDLVAEMTPAIDDVNGRQQACGAGGAGGNVSCATSGIDACTLASITMATLPSHINNHCTANLLTVLDTLIELQELGVDRYDQAALWRGVQRGVDVVGDLVLTANDDDPQRALTPDVVERIVRVELAPILCLPGVEIRDAFALVAPTSPPPGRVVAVESVDADVDVARAKCFQTCMNMPGSCAVAHFDAATRTCYSADSYSALSAFRYGGGEGEGEGEGEGGGGGALRSVYVADPAVFGNKCKRAPEPFRLCGSSSPPGCGTDGEGGGDDFLSSLFATDACVQTTPAQLYKLALANGAAASTLLDQRDELAQRVTLVLRRHKFAISLDRGAARQALDAALVAYYGQDVYAAGVAAAVELVLKRVRAAARASGAPADDAFVDPLRLADKVGALSRGDADALLVALRKLQNAATSHRDLYPAYRPAFALRTSGVAGALTNAAVLVSFVVFVVVLYDLNKHQDITVSGAVQAIISGACMVVIFATVVDNMSTTSRARLQHNQDAIDDNGETLVAATINVADDFARAAAVAKRADLDSVAARNEAMRPSCVAVLADCRVLLGKFAACNSITSGQARFPFPTSDVVLLGVIAILFLAFGAAVFTLIKPAVRFEHVRSLFDLRGRVLRGDPRAYAEARHVVQCARPAADVWQVFVWMGVVCLVSATVWLMWITFGAADDFEAALAMDDDCR
jgi:hypothetical protein